MKPDECGVGADMALHCTRIIEGYGNRDVRFVPVKSALGVGCAAIFNFEDTV